MKEDFKEAEDLYSKVLILYPKNPISFEARFRLAIVLYNQGRYKDAQAVYQKALEEATDPELKIEAIHQVADCLLKQNKAAGAISYYKLWLEKLDFPEKRWKIQLKIAEIYYQTGEKELAREEYERFLEFGPQDMRDSAYYWIARSYLPDQPKDAFKYFKKVVDLYPQSDWAADSLFKMGVILDEDGDTKEAKIIFERFIKEYKERQDLVIEAKRYLKGYGKN
jgi:TolA-binding protein